eukprot:gene17960-52913_t
MVCDPTNYDYALWKTAKGYNFIVGKSEQAHKSLPQHQLGLRKCDEVKGHHLYFIREQPMYSQKADPRWLQFKF